MKFYLLIASLFLTVQLSAQTTKKETFRLPDYEAEYISLPDSTPHVFATTKFNRVVVKDARADTAVLAFGKHKYYTMRYTAGAIETAINKSLQLTSHADTGNQLVIFIKKIWATKQFELEKNEWNGGVFWKTNVFIK